MWVLYAVLSAFFASLTAILAKVGVKDVDSDLAMAIRTAVILVLAWSIVFFRKGVPAIGSISRHSMLFLVLSGLATGCSWIFYFWALQAGNVSKVAPVDKLSVALTILLAFIFLKEPVSAKDIVGAGLIIGGTLVLVF